MMKQMSQVYFPHTVELKNSLQVPLPCIRALLAESSSLLTESPFNALLAIFLRPQQCF